MKRSRLNPMSKKRRDDIPRRQEVRERVFERDGGCLLRFTDTPCFGLATPHHRLRASQGGGYTEANLITLCEGHHLWVHDNPAQAAAMGLLVLGASR